MNLVVTKEKNLQQFNSHLHDWTEAETKPDSQVESLLNVAEFKLISLYYCLTTTMISLRST